MHLQAQDVAKANRHTEPKPSGSDQTSWLVDHAGPYQHELEARHANEAIIVHPCCTLDKPKSMSEVSLQSNSIAMGAHCGQA